MSQMPAPELERQLAWYNQNSENFRGLNTLMWQIPLIAMTLTGGLWFGVSNVKDSPFFQMGLLLLACAGNMALIFVLHRLRFVMGAYMKWLNDKEPGAKIEPEGKRFYEKNYVVRTTFQTVLGIAALISFCLFVVTAWKAWHTPPQPKTLATYYHGYAALLADEYEVGDFATAHPYLAATLPRSNRLTILHIGSGAARDATTMTAMGHDVLVASPSASLIGVRPPAEAVRPWTVRTALPDLTSVRGARRFDLIVLNAAWAHVPTEQRRRLVDRLLDLLRPAGRLYIAFRDGPAEPDRLIYASSITEFQRLVGGTRAKMHELPARTDLLGRPNVSWRSIVIQVPADPTP